MIFINDLAKMRLTAGRPATGADRPLGGYGLNQTSKPVRATLYFPFELSVSRPNRACSALLDPTNHSLLLAAGEGMRFTSTTEGSDVDVLGSGCITVTPLSYIMTDGDRMQEWRESLED